MQIFSLKLPAIIWKIFFLRSKIVGLARLLYYFRNASFDFGFTALIIFTNIKVHFFINFKASPQN